MMNVYSSIKDRVEVLPWVSLAALLLASAERLAGYWRAYLRLESAASELDLGREPDLESVLERGWRRLQGETGAAVPGFGFDGELDSLWGPMAAQTKAHIFDVAEGVAKQASMGHLRTLLRSGLEIVESLQEFADDGYLRGLPSWDGPVGDEGRAIEADLEWVAQPMEAVHLRRLQQRWRNAEGVLVLEEGQ